MGSVECREEGKAKCKVELVGVVKAQQWTTYKRKNPATGV